MTRDAITLRPIQPDDEPFLRAVYASTRQAEMDAVGWPQAQRDAFLRMQFDAQHRHYQAYFPDAQFSIVEVNGRAAGRLYVHRGTDEFIIIDIALLPGSRAGVGRLLIREILTEAAAAGLPVRGHVEQNNPAIRLFKRLGFVITGETGPLFKVECPAPRK